MKVLGCGATALVCTALAYYAMSSSEAKALQPPPRTRAAATLHTLSAKNIGGVDFGLASLAGKAALLVNVASS
jgi:hypothetical protein